MEGSSSAPFIQGGVPWGMPPPVGMQPPAHAQWLAAATFAAPTAAGWDFALAPVSQIEFHPPHPLGAAATSASFAVAVSRTVTAPRLSALPHPPHSAAAPPTSQPTEDASALGLLATASTAGPMRASKRPRAPSSRVRDALSHAEDAESRAGVEEDADGSRMRGHGRAATKRAHRARESDAVGVASVMLHAGDEEEEGEEPAARVTATAAAASIVHKRGPDSLHNRKKAWTQQEDDLLRDAYMRVAQAATDVVPWRTIAEMVRTRTGKQCRERWLAALQPEVKKSEWTEAEDTTLFHQLTLCGRRWSEIARHLPGRPPHACKNRYYATCRRIARQRAAGTLNGGAVAVQPRVDTGAAAAMRADGEAAGAAAIGSDSVVEGQPLEQSEEMAAEEEAEMQEQ